MEIFLPMIILFALTMIGFGVFFNEFIYKADRKMKAKWVKDYPQLFDKNGNFKD